MAVDHLLGVGDAERVEVADGDHADGILLEQAGHVHLAADAAAADLQDVDLLARCVGAEDACRDDRGEANRGRGESSGLEKMASGCHDC